MSRWVLRYDHHRRGWSCFVCEDIGDIRSFNFLDHGRSFSVVNDVQEYHTWGQTLPIRRSGSVYITLPFTYPTISEIKFSHELQKVGSNIDESDVVNYLRSDAEYYRAYCIDSRVLALVNGSVDLMFMHAEHSKYERLYRNIPTKESGRIPARQRIHIWQVFHTKRIRNNLPSK